MWGRSVLGIKLLNSSYNTKYYAVKVQKTLQTLLDSNRLVKGQRTLSTQLSETKIVETKSKPTYDKNVADFNTFTYRTHTCGELRAKHIGENVILCGWVQYARLSKFLLIRDSYGLTQCIVNNTDIDINVLPLETIVKVVGTVAPRPKDMYNHEMSTGEIEIVINKLEILNEVSKLPFNLRNYQKPKEQLRLQHRYIDLRFPEMQNVLRQRSMMLHNMRKFLVEENNFVEVETPTLFCRTPGGAREFVVPTHHSGLFYSLVQSPQQFKQMLMAGGIDRYFQIARCYRDEATRPDRQPEFTQLDIELSFTSFDGILNLIEMLLRKTFNSNLPKSLFKRMTYNEALENYGTDKPNIKYDMKLKNVSSLFSQSSTDTNFAAFMLPYPNNLGKLSAKYREKINVIRKKYNVKVVPNENISKDIGHEISKEIKCISGEQNDNVLCMGEKESVCLCLGEIREVLAGVLKLKSLININENLEPFWIVDFPLFVKGEDGLLPCHHPFTAPHPDDLHLLDSDPLKVRSLAYDIVLNGHEIGGGSVRIHNAELQERILKMLNIDSSGLSHFINALKSGCPPHAGIALGIDRLMAVLCNAESIRDVIAFPKNHDGKDPLSGAPSKISIEDQKYYHIRSIET